MTGDTTMSFALLIALVTIACTVYNTLTGKKSQSQKDVDQQIKEATQKVAADTKISLKLDQIGYDVKSIKEDINTTKKEVRELDKKVALLDASIRSAHKRIPSRYSCDTLALNSGECFDFGMKNTSKVTDFYI